MNKLISSILFAYCCICLSSCVVMSHTYEDNSYIKYDGLFYEITCDGSTVELVKKGYWISTYEFEEVVVPSTITYNGNSYAVTSIGEGAFFGCSNLKKIVLPPSIESIKENAFNSCHSLTQLTIPEGVTTIESCAFHNSGIMDNPSYLKDGAIYIDNCLIRVLDTTQGVFAINADTRLIAASAFAGSKSINSVTIPKNVQHIGAYIFAQCTALESIVVEEGNPIYNSQNNCNAIIETASNTLIAGCKNTLIPTDIISIGPYAFLGLDIQSITLPNNVIHIEEGAFAICESLSQVTISEGVENIGNYAFYGCESLTQIDIPSSVKIIGKGAFAMSKKLRHVNISEGLESIDNYAFAACKSLRKISLPRSVSDIGDEAFIECSSLRIINVSWEQLSSFRYMIHKGHKMRAPKEDEDEDDIWE